MKNLNNTIQTEFQLTDTEIAALLDATKDRNNSNNDTQSNNREHHRFTPFNNESVATFQHPGDTKDKCQALLLDISASGVGIAIKGFLHKGTSISISIYSNDGQCHTISGFVRWCEFFDKQIHMIGVSLFEQIDPRNFAKDIGMITLSISNDDTAWITERHALAIQDDQNEFNALQSLMLNANIKASQANTVKAALQGIKEVLVDLLVLYDSPYDKTDAHKTIKKLKNKDYTGPIIVLSNSSEARKESLLKAGAITVIQRPLELPVLLNELRDIFNINPAPTDSTAPIHSTLSTQHCSESFFNKYIGLINESIPRLEINIKDDDSAAALKICSTLYSTGAKFGFPLLSTAAHQATNALNTTNSTKESEIHLRNLIHIIRRLKGPVPKQTNTKPRNLKKAI